MKFYSTNKKIKKADFRQVLMEGLAADSGLFLPEAFPKISKDFLKNIQNKKFWEIALEISRKFIKDIPEKDLKEISQSAFDFPIPLVKLDKNLYVLELFHGPTLAFKDFGARFMARVMNYYLKRDKKKLNIIVATSGDTGSAVAYGFYGLSNIKVFVLYPSRRITKLQEKQMATLGKNIVAIEVRGSFDDCQALAKKILSDHELKRKINLSSANSINFGRLLPQTFYYFWAIIQFYGHRKTVGLAMTPKLPIFCVPSGNFGNLTAGLMAKRMGLPVKQFIAATNANDVVPEYLKIGKFVSHISRKTISNAMDVGNPSNFARMLEMYGNDFRKMAKDIIGISASDKQTRETIKNVYREIKYVADPHTAVGIAAARKSGVREPIVVLATAHPAKFRNIVEPLIGKKIKLPRQLKSVMKKKKKSIFLENNLEDLKKIIFCPKKTLSFS